MTQGPRTASVAFVLISMALSTLGIGLVVPVMPRLVADLTQGDVAADARMYGLFAASYAAMQFLFAPVLGGLSDQFGRRKVILASTLGAAADYALLTVAPSVGWLFVGRVVSGITGASFSSATAYIADVTPPEKRAQAFGLVGAAFGLGFILGPALGGALGEIHVRAPFVAAAGLNFLNFLYGVFVLPESLKPEARRRFDLRRANPLGALRGFTRNPALLGLAGTIACGYLAQNVLQSVWALNGQYRYGWSPLAVGSSLAVVGLATATVQGGLIRLIIPRLGERRSIVVGGSISVAGFVGLGLAEHGWVLLLVILPFSLRGIVGPSIQALLTRWVSASEQGELQGSLTSMNSVMAIVGPLLGTWLLGHFQGPSASISIPGAPFFASALLELGGLLLAVRLFAKLPSHGPG